MTGGEGEGGLAGGLHTLGLEICRNHSGDWPLRDRVSCRDALEILS